MNELIRVDFTGERPAVSARELHEFLGVGTKYADWFPRMCEYGFTEGQDFNLLKNEQVRQEGNRMVSRMVDDAAVSIDMAKEICMLQRNEKGKLARQYFLQLEKDWNSPEKVMARALQIVDKKIKELEEHKLALEAEAKANAPLVLFAKGVEGSSNSILVRDMAKILNQNGIQIGGNRLFDWLRQNGYLVKQKGRDKNMPTQRAMELGLFEIKETVVYRTNGTETHRTPLITGKGQTYFYNLLRQWPGFGRQARPV